MCFLALSRAPPPHIIIMASGMAVIVAPMTRAPMACQPRVYPTMMGVVVVRRVGVIMSLRAFLVAMSTAVV